MVEGWFLSVGTGGKFQVSVGIELDDFLTFHCTVVECIFISKYESRKILTEGIDQRSLIASNQR
jgi:hypothetical protein